MGSRVTDVVAQELGIREFNEYPPRISMFGITSVEIESEGQRYRVYLVKDTNEEVTNSLEECARLCAYYNSRFVLQYVAANKIDYPVGKLLVNFQIEDREQTHSVFVLEVPKGNYVKNTLNREELVQIAGIIAKLHGKTAETLGKEFYTTINENHSNVSLYEKKISLTVIDILKESVKKEYAHFFTRPSDVIEMLTCLVNEEGREFKNVPYSEVICHGNLTAMNCVFGGINDELVEITNWECVNFGDPTQDITNLLITSADPETRRNHFMTVFRAYYYALIEVRPLKFNLSNLKNLYRKNSKKVVISSIEWLLDILASNSSEQEKTAVARRWEAALFDVYHFEFGDYISDDEQCYFEK